MIPTPDQSISKVGWLTPPEEDTLRNEGPGCDESPYEKRNKEPRINELGCEEPGIEDPRPQKPCERWRDNPLELDDL